LHTFRVQIDAPGDAVPQNDTLEGATVVAPPGRVLLAVSDPAAATALATALARAHLSVIPTLAAGLPTSVAAYRGYDDVVLDGVAKIDMVKVAASSALDKLAEGDAVGVLAFDDSNHWTVPFHILQGTADKANIRRQISRLSADGDTYIYPALQAAERAVLRVPTIYRHVVLLTDGQGEDAGFDRLIRRMHRAHITLSTIGVGQDVVQDELRHWAKLGGGLFHYVSDPHDIPRIVVNEARYG